MASNSLRTGSRAAAFICDSCLIKISSRRTGRLLSQCHRTVASSASYATSARNRRNRPTISSALFADVAQCSSSLRSHSTVNQLVHPSDSGIAPLPHRRLISLAGQDAAKLLQGLLSNNVSSSRDSPFYAAFLDARGRVLWDVFIWTYPELIAGRAEWACYIEVDAQEVENLYKHLRRHKLRSKVDLKVLGEEDISVWAAWGDVSEQLSGESLLATLVDPRGPNFGTRCLYKGSEGPDSNVDIKLLDTQQYHLRRYFYGIPEGQQEILRENSLPMESNLDLNQGIDFKKGCYVGQELTIRTKHTGVVRKRILPVQLYTSEHLPKSLSESKSSDLITSFDPTSTIPVPETGSDIKQLGEDGSIKKGRAAGKFITGIGNVGLALCRLEMMTSMKISAEGGSWKPGVEFGVEKDGEVVRVKPVVYQWFRERERDLWDKGRTRV